MAWAYQGLKVRAPAAMLAGGSVGAVRLAVASFDRAFNPVALPANTYDHLTLEIDTTPLTAAYINSFLAFDSGGNPMTSIGSSADCPAFNVGPGGYVVLSVSVRDDNGHLCFLRTSTDFRHGSSARPYLTFAATRQLRADKNVAAPDWSSVSQMPETENF